MDGERESHCGYTYQAVHLVVDFQTGEDATSLALVQPNDVLVQRMAELQVFFFGNAEGLHCGSRDLLARLQAWT